MTFSRVSVKTMDRMLKAAEADGERPFATFRKWASDPEFRAQHDAETQSWRDSTNALIDAGMRRAREKREAGK